MNSSGQLGAAFNESNVALLDANQTFSGADTFGGNVTLGGNLILPTTSASTGIIYAGGGQTLLHTFGTGDFFAGTGAGNLSMSGILNTGCGAGALASNGTGYENTGTGWGALSGNTSGNNNTANGTDALGANTTGVGNTANGSQTLVNNTNGYGNTACGFQVLISNTSGDNNTADGINALLNNTTGSYNTAQGYSALMHNTTGNYNIALGYDAGLNLTTGSSNIDLGNFGTAADANIIRIGFGQSQTYVAGISGATASGGVPVYINSSGQLGTVSDVASVALLNGSQTFTAANTFNGVVTLNNTVQDFNGVFMNDHDLQFRNDTLHGVGWYGLATKTFAGLNVNGPALYGNGGGVLGTKSPTSTNAAVQWDASGRVIVDPNAVNAGGMAPGIFFGGVGGEGIASQRTVGTDQFSLQFYTDFLSRLTILNNGNVGVGTNAPQQALHVVGNILATGTVTGSSDRNAKENFVPVNPREVLDKVAALPISRWNYKTETEVTHLGPMAQDFYSAFAVGQDDKHISMVDADGVALAAIQGLHQQLKEKDAEIHSLQVRLARLEQLVAQ